ncbi:hypothetical protein CYANOKiyG1_05370 [Okeania sp. KiyG1]|nr:hypothetical protein CYANOKiyG1_05370 [Okeania sp. KiyG1]
MIAIAHIQKDRITVKKIIISLAKLATIEIGMKNNVELFHDQKIKSQASPFKDRKKR